MDLTDSAAIISQAAATPFGKQDEEWSKVHLALLLVLDDV